MKEIAVVNKKSSIFRFIISIVMIGFAALFIILFALGQAKNSVGFVITAAIIFIIGGIFFLVLSIKTLTIKNPILVYDGKDELILYKNEIKKKTEIKVLDIVSMEVFLLSNRRGKNGKIGSLDIVTKQGTYELRNIDFVLEVKEEIEKIKNNLLLKTVEE